VRAGTALLELRSCEAPPIYPHLFQFFYFLLFYTIFEVFSKLKIKRKILSYMTWF